MPFVALIVDDSALMRTFVKRVMRLAGFDQAEYLEAGDGNEALARLRTNAVDLILTDINMPNLNGEELLAEIAKNEALRGIPVLVISTDATNDRVHRMLALGAREYITKPFTPETLRGKLGQILLDPAMEITCQE